MIKSFHFFSASLLAILLSGCAHKCVVVDSSELNAQSKVGRSSFSTQVVVSNPSLHTQGELYKGNAVLTNNTQYDQNIKYQFQWYTIEGYAVGENQPWVPLTLSPARVQPVESMSPSKNAVHYKIMVCKEK
jgi:uncharacterized protein YcfL